ncbi:MAG: zinc-finger domain-containing protein [Alphaproteobacteria bacterium]
MALEAPEIINVDPDSDEVMCDGGGGALGHPQVWYTFDGQSSVECGYCDRLFVKADAPV